MSEKPDTRSGNRVVSFVLGPRMRQRLILHGRIGTVAPDGHVITTSEIVRKVVMEFCDRAERAVAGKD